MSVTTAVVVPAAQAEHIDNIFKGLVRLGGVLAMSRDGVRDGIAFREVFKKDSMEAQELCLAAGFLAGEDWLEVVNVGGPAQGLHPRLRRSAGSPKREPARLSPQEM
jgi:hypothetical protein